MHKVTKICISSLENGGSPVFLKHLVESGKAIIQKLTIQIGPRLLQQIGRSFPSGAVQDKRRAIRSVYDELYQTFEERNKTYPGCISPEDQCHCVRGLVGRF